MSNATEAHSFNLDEIASRIYQTNIQNGWQVTVPEDYTDHETPYRCYKIPAVLALIASEIDEAAQARDLSWHAEFAEEIADVAIRVLDLTAGLGKAVDHMVTLDEEGFYRFLGDPVLGMHCHCSQALEIFRKPDRYPEDAFLAEMGCLLSDCFAIARIHNFDLVADIERKNEKNKGRGFRHGGKRV